jgi:hypothetical protein
MFRVKDQKLQLSVNETERAEIQAMADRHGLKMATYLRQAVMRGLAKDKADLCAASRGILA